MWRRAAILSCLLCFGGLPAFADPSITGHRLLNWCRSEQATPLWMLCLGYVAGVSDHLERVEGAARYCPPEGLSDEEERDIVVAYLDENERLRRNSALDLIVESLREAHPCT